MDPLSVIEGIGGLVEGGVNTVESFLASAQQQKNQETTWAREDNAVQRRVADLKAAGLSPTLAAGSAASSSAPISVMTPKSSVVSSGISAAASAQDIARSTAEQKLTETQQVAAEADAWLKQRDKSIAQIQDSLQSDNNAPVGRAGLALNAQRLANANSDAAEFAAARARADADLSGMRSDWWKASGLPPGDVPGDVMSSLSRSQIIGLPKKAGVLIGSFWDALKALKPSESIVSHQ